MKIAVAIGLMLTLTSPGEAQSSATEPLKLIYLNVVAVDSRGEPVSDLTAEDLEITDAGKLQKVVLFNHRDAKLTKPVSLKPNEYSNRAGTVVSHPTLILFDLLNERFGTRGVASNQLIQFLQPLETANDLYLYLLTVDGRLIPVRGIQQEESAVPPEGTAPWTRDIKKRLDSALRQAARVRPPEIDVNVRVELTYRALDAVALELSRVPGRKNIVWVTDGVPLALSPGRSDTGDFVDYLPLLRQFSEGMTRSGVAIYPVQQIMIGSPDAMGASAGGIESGRTASRGGVVGAGLGSLQTLDEFAGLTGGRVNQGKDIGAAIKQARSDLSTSYKIGYYPPPENWDGKFHKLRIHCKRKGVHIQAKTGYYAWKDAPEKETLDAIESAISAGFDAGEIGLHATVSPDSKDPQLRHVGLRIDAKDIALPREGTPSVSCGSLRSVTFPMDATRIPRLFNSISISPLTSAQRPLRTASVLIRI